MFRLLLSALAVMTASTGALAQAIPECPSAIVLIRPAVQITPSAIPSFRWKAEPARTASREVAIFDGDGKTVLTGKAHAFKGTFKAPPAGAYGWFVTFKDARGRPICRSAAGTLAVVRDIPVVTFASNGPAPAGIASVYMDTNGRYVIVLRDSPYTGPRSFDVLPSDDFDGRNFDLGNAIGLVIHGNNNPNVIYGTDGSDVIYAYRSGPGVPASFTTGDQITPGSGRDEVYLEVGKHYQSFLDLGDDGYPDTVSVVWENGAAVSSWGRDNSGDTVSFN